MKVETIDYKGFKIQILRDEYPQNPFVDWDGLYPLMFNFDRANTDYSHGAIDRYLVHYLTDTQLTRNQSDILDLIGESKESFDDDFPLNLYSGVERADRLRDSLSDWMSESLENRMYFCELFNIKHYFGETRGYSQGDAAEVFICWTPEFENITGVTYKKATVNGMTGSFKLFGNWMWGDVYGYNIKEIDSCWGFYGDNFEENGLLEEAKGAIDYYLKSRRDERISKAKTLIKNRVPLDKRSDILAAVI